MNDQYDIVTRQKLKCFEESAVSCRNRVHLLFGCILLLATVLVGCRNQEPKPPDHSSGLATPGPEDKTGATAKRSQLNQRQREVLQAVEQTGGTYDRNDKGAVNSIDLASDRVFAGESLIRSLTAFPELKRLRLSVMNASLDAFETLESLNQLTELFLQGASLSDQQLVDILAAMPRLERLGLRRIRGVSDDLLPALDELPQLKTLALIEMNDITGDTLTGLADIESLSALDLRNCGNLKTEDFQHLLKLDELTDLKVGGPAVNDQTLKVIAQHPSVSSVSIEDAQVSSQCLQCLTSPSQFAKQLRSLSFARCFGVSDETLHALRRFPNLHTLSLRDIFVTGGFIGQLGESDTAPPPLKRLIMTNGVVNDDALTALPDVFPQLERLDLRGNSSVTDASWAVFDRLSELEELRLKETGVSNKQQLSP